MEFKLDTEVFKNGIIKQELLTEENDLPQRVGNWVINTREKSVKEALIKLGWTPPVCKNNSMDKDVTDQVEFGLADGDSLPLTKCVCGKEYDNWDFIIHTYSDHNCTCDCGRKLYFKINITVYERVKS